jgi:hypothetical protein
MLHLSYTYPIFNAYSQANKLLFVAANPIVSMIVVMVKVRRSSILKCFSVLELGKAANAGAWTTPATRPGTRSGAAIRDARRHISLFAPEPCVAFNLSIIHNHYPHFICTRATTLDCAAAPFKSR